MAAAFTSRSIGPTSTSTSVDQMSIALGVRTSTTFGRTLRSPACGPTQPDFIDVDRDDMHVVGREPPRRQLAHAAGRAGDHRNAPRERHHPSAFDRGRVAAATATRPESIASTGAVGLRVLLVDHPQQPEPHVPRHRTPHEQRGTRHDQAETQHSTGYDVRQLLRRYALPDVPTSDEDGTQTEHREHHAGYEPHPFGPRPPVVGCACRRSPAWNSSMRSCFSSISSASRGHAAAQLSVGGMSPR